MASLRDRRVAQERLLLERLAQDNPDLVTPPQPADSGFRCKVRGAEALLPDGSRQAAHGVRLVFPRFYPGTPIEAYLDQPVTHPNVDPANGFVCLWNRTSIGDTAVEAVRRLRLIIAWKSWNLDAEHIMQPAAADLARAGETPDLIHIPLAGLPEKRSPARAPRPRLSDPLGPAR